MKNIELNKEEEKIIEQHRKKKQKEAKEDKSKNKKKRFNMKTFTKTWITRLLIILCIWVTWTYVLTTFAVIKGFDTNVIQALSELSQKALEVILGTILGYMCKSFWETYKQEKTKLEYARDGLEYNDFDDSNI